MRQVRLAGLSVAIAVGLLVTGAAQAQTKSMEFRNGEVLAVDGNVVTVRGQDGVKQFVVPDDFWFEMEGKQYTLKDLKPGMKYNAMVTKIETPIEVTATEIRQGEVVYNAGGTIVVRDTATKEMKQFTPQDLKTKGVVVYMDGKEMDPMKLRKGDKFSATIVTKMPPKVITEHELAVFASAPPKPATVASNMPPPPPPSQPARAPAELPKTGSLLPLIGLVGTALTGIGAGMTGFRRFAKKD